MTPISGVILKMFQVFSKLFLSLKLDKTVFTVAYKAGPNQFQQM